MIRRDPIMPPFPAEAADPVSSASGPSASTPGSDGAAACPLEPGEAALPAADRVLPAAAGEQAPAAIKQAASLAQYFEELALDELLSNSSSLAEALEPLAAQTGHPVRRLIRLYLQHKRELKRMARRSAGQLSPVPNPPREFETYPLSAAAQAPEKKLRICIATRDYRGMVRNGGIGTAMAYLAELLAREGHHVTVAFALADSPECTSTEKFAAECRQQGINLVLIPRGGLSIEQPESYRESYDMAMWLRTQRFDIIHFHEWNGLPYYTVCLKDFGQAFQKTLIAVTTHSPTQWCDEEGRVFVTASDKPAIYHMEQQSIARADVLLSPSRYMLEWLHGRNWKLPERSWILPNLPPAAAETPEPDACGQPLPEFVFFGRLETRKGVELFCRAIDHLTAGTSAPFAVTFLGKPGVINGKPALHYIAQRTGTWRSRVRILTEFSQQEALEYLCQPGRTAVIASFSENSPYTVIECLALGIPFLAARAGGIPELIADDVQPRVLFDHNPKDLAARMNDVLSHGGQKPAAPRLNREAAEQYWIALHADIAAGRLSAQEKPSETEPAKAQPLVSICIPHKDRGECLLRALGSVKNQTYSALEVLVVDDGSSKEQTLAILNDIENTAWPFPLRVLHQRGGYTGSARNYAAAQARGRYLLFLDDDNIALPEAAAKFVAAAENSGADIVTCALDVFAGPAHPPEPLMRYCPVGPALTIAVFLNCIGDAYSLHRREQFLDAGGFSEDWGIGYEDLEFFVRSTLDGRRIEVFPEALQLYRSSCAGTLYDSLGRPALFKRYFRLARDILPDYLYAPVCAFAEGMKTNGFLHRKRYPSASQLAACAYFFAAPEVLLHCSPEKGFNNIVPLGETAIRENKAGLVVSSGDGDPQFLLPPLHVPAERNLHIRLRLNCRSLDVCKIYYMAAGETEFNEPSTVERRVQAGQNDLFFTLPVARLGQLIRIDPFYRGKECVIQEIEVRV